MQAFYYSALYINAIKDADIIFSNVVLCVYRSALFNFI